MIIKKFYNEETKTEKAWFDSTMIVFTKAIEYDTENKVDLYVTFKNGATYKYIGVSLSDYVVFIAGGTDLSNGKALNKIIKPKYEFERVEDVSVPLLMEELETLKKEQEENTHIKNNTYFISGHRDISEEEFEIYYQNEICNVLEENPDAYFIVGDYYGADIMAQNYLLDVLKIEPSHITVYHMLEKPRNVNPKVINLVGGFTSDEERDSEMTRKSIGDIAFVRDYTKLSGTAQNILRRHCFSF